MNWNAPSCTSWRPICNEQTDASVHRPSNPHAETIQISATGKCLSMTLVCGRLTLPLQLKVKGSMCFPVPFSPLFFSSSHDALNYDSGQLSWRYSERTKGFQKWRKQELGWRGTCRVSLVWSGRKWVEPPASHWHLTTVWAPFKPPSNLGDFRICRCKHIYKVGTGKFTW